MSEPVEISIDFLYAKIGRQAVEIDVLRAQLAQAQRPSEPPAEPEEPRP